MKPKVNQSQLKVNQKSTIYNIKYIYKYIYINILIYKGITLVDWLTHFLMSVCTHADKGESTTFWSTKHLTNYSTIN